MPGDGIFRRPGPVNLKSGNIDANNWTHFKQKFKNFLIATSQSAAASAVKWALLLGEAGDDALEVYNFFKSKLITRTVSENDAEIITDNTQSYSEVLREFDAYAAEKKSLTACKETFNKRNEKASESFSSWLTDLKNVVRRMEDSMLKDRIV